jgi:hypothetical protein
LRTFVTDGERMHDVQCVRLHAYSFGAESGKEESMTVESSSAPFLRC